MHVRASEPQPLLPPTLCGCESPICPGEHLARAGTAWDAGMPGPDLAWIAGRRARLGLTGAMTQHRVIRHAPRHA